MTKKAKALHLVEKGIHVQNLRPVPGVPGEWFTGDWWVSDSTAASLIGKMLYLHPGQMDKSHQGGEVISFAISQSDPKRKVFRFREMKICSGKSTPKAGWSNEKKVIWAKSQD
jgi:hypothetical protein